MGGGGKGGGKAKVTRHYLSMMFGICAAGREMELLELKFGEKIAWAGNLKINGSVEIDKRDLFGGDKKEGGVAGVLTWLNGGATQTLPEFLASKFGKTSATCPGYRGFASIFLTGAVPAAPAETTDDDGNPISVDPLVSSLSSAGDSGRGFYVAANNPYLKAPSVRVRRPPEGLNPAVALIRLPDNSAGRAQYAANAVHIIFEAMLNQDWGMGESYGMFNIQSFEQCAQVIYNENFGLNILWNRQSKIEDFIKIIIDHIQAAVFVDPATGKHTMKLLRGDYTVGSLKTVSPSNAKLSNFKTKLWSDISNEVVVTWTNPESGKEETVTVQDLAGIAAQGGITSTSRNYHGIGSRELAIFAGERDLAAVAYPLATCDAEVTKEFWRTVVNDCVVLSWPRHGIQSAVFRVAEVARGSSSRTVRLRLIEDVFSLAHASYAGSQDSEWVNPSTDPQPLTNRYLGTLPAFLTVPALGLNDISELPYPEVLSAVVAAPDSADDIAYELVGYTTSATGAVTLTSLGERELVGLWTSNVPLIQQATTQITIDSGFIGSLPERGNFILIGSGDDAVTEIAIVIGVNGNRFTLARGMLDTVPHDWPSGTRFLILPAGLEGDSTVRSAFEIADYHLKTITTQGILPIYNAPKESVTLSERPHLPNRPANVAIEGVAFGTYDLQTRSTMTITWANRNRLTEATQAPRWTNPSASLEPGQATQITILNSADRSIVTTIPDLPGTSYSLGREHFNGVMDAIVRVTATRDGLESLQGHEIRVIMAEDLLLLENGVDTLNIGGGDKLVLEG